MMGGAENGPDAPGAPLLQSSSAVAQTRKNYVAVRKSRNIHCFHFFFKNHKGVHPSLSSSQT